MKHTQEEIFNALKVLNEECVDNRICVTCPLHAVEDEMRCGIKRRSPSSYRLNNPNKPWSAFRRG